MIRIERGPEPSELVDIRARGLDRARRAIEAGELPAFGRGYVGTSTDPVAFKSAMWDSQHGKCAWCEMRNPKRNRDVEHYRPKSLYWWLAWSWENLFFACDNCNRYCKRADFPLAEKGVPLAPEAQPPGLERPLLLDPSNPQDNPQWHIRFRPFKRGGKRWLALPRYGSERGRATIQLLRMNDDVPVELRQLQYDTMQGWLSDLHELRDRPEDWNRQVRRYTSPKQVFSAFNRDIVDNAFPAPLRRELGLRLPAIQAPPASTKRPQPAT